MDKKQLETIKEFVSATPSDFDILYHIDDFDLLECEDGADVLSYFENLNEDLKITNEEVIYYYNAMEYLSEYDSSLNESMELARDLGVEYPNSETLATLLKSENNLNDYRDFLEELERFLDDNF